MLYILLIKWLKIFQALYNSICTKSKFPNKAGITDYVLSNPFSKSCTRKKASFTNTGISVQSFLLFSKGGNSIIITFNFQV